MMTTEDTKDTEGNDPKRHLNAALEAVAEVARKLKEERDEARDKMADALQEVDLRTLDYERMKQERDEAREKLCKVLQILDNYDQAIKNPSSPFWEVFKKWFTWEAAK